MGPQKFFKRGWEPLPYNGMVLQTAFQWVFTFRHFSDNSEGFALRHSLPPTPHQFVLWQIVFSGWLGLVQGMDYVYYFGLIRSTGSPVDPGDSQLCIRGQTVTTEGWLEVTRPSHSHYSYGFLNISPEYHYDPWMRSMACLWRYLCV